MTEASQNQSVSGKALSFIHLRVHTEYSLVDSMVRVKPLMAALAGDHMPAAALTDQSNLFAMVKFTRAALAAGIKPIIGVDLWVRQEDEQGLPYRLVLLCKNREGYLNLSQLISRSYLEGQHGGVPMVQSAWVEEFSEGLIALSGGREGEIGRALLAGQKDLARERLEHWKSVFPNSFYLELIRTGRENEEAYIVEAVELALQTGTPVVATNDVRFLKAEDFDAHEVRVCINGGRTLDDPRRAKNYSNQQYLRTAEEMQALFEDIPEALENSVEIAKRCNLVTRLGKSVLPEFPVPEGDTIETYFTRLSEEGLAWRLETLLDPTAEDYEVRKAEYEERLRVEIKVIIDMGFPGYFLIVADFIQWSKDNGIPVGPGRGSGAGSLVAYALKITDLDPLEFDLLFERFLNPERVSLPDFDIDFCMEGRDRVIDYVAQKYGRRSVSQIITYGSMAAKAVVRDVGRVLGQPYGFVDRIAKMVPFEIGMTLTKALKESEELNAAYEDEEDVHDLIDMALSLEGLSRNAGKHAGGVVISPTVLTDFTPLYCEEGGQSIVTQFDKDDVEAVGLVKFDFLGLRTLTIIDWAVKHINKARDKTGEAHLVIEQIPMDDQATFDLLQAANTTAVFQLESRGMKDLITRLKPDSFEDIIALVALFRPGPLQSGMVDNFINRKHGREEVSYPDKTYQHQSLKPILEPTYGIILYQEQVMQIAQVLAGYTLGGADMLRRAMGKKKPEVMAKERAVFEEGAKNNGIDPNLAIKIFDLVEKFAGYGFNKSHSAAYALLSYQTAFLKQHYPAEFMAAVLSADMDNTDKVVFLIEDCHEQKLEVIPPNVNQSLYHFSVPDSRTVLYGLGAIKGVGEAALEGIIKEREENGNYIDLYDFCRRSDTRKVNRRVLEALIKAGAMDELGAGRSSLVASLNNVLQLAEQNQKDALAGQDDMFSAVETSDDQEAVHMVKVAEWDDELRLSYEKETLGLYLTGHPIEKYENEIRQFTDFTLAKAPDFAPKDSGGGNGGYRKKNTREYRLAGLMLNMRTRKTQRGSKIVTAVLDDRTARIDVVIYEEAYEKFSHLLEKDKLLVVDGPVSYDDFNGSYRIVASAIYDMTQAREKFSRCLEINIDKTKANGSWSEAELTRNLSDVLQAYREGQCPVCIQYNSGKELTRMTLGDDWRVQPNEDLLGRLRHLFSDEQVNVIY
ncbi:MAG: DNA polymerase III subunit alpha [Gammaproteobacteria bacterium]|nr:DNA polymerase III subunit alpha [Gammaproteobacteria bacterium]